MQKHWSQIGLIVSIAITATLVLGFVGESVGLFGGGGGGNSNRPRALLCTNPECAEQFEVTGNEFMKMHKELMESGGGAFGMSPMMQPRFNCKFCEEQSVFVAEKCDECETVFIPNYGMTDEFPDTCPECGYSKIEERINNQE